MVPSDEDTGNVEATGTNHSGPTRPAVSPLCLRGSLAEDDRDPGARAGAGNRGRFEPEKAEARKKDTGDLTVYPRGYILV